jgi:hypothetical protein
MPADGERVPAPRQEAQVVATVASATADERPKHVLLDDQVLPREEADQLARSWTSNSQTDKTRALAKMCDTLTPPSGDEPGSHTRLRHVQRDTRAAATIGNLTCPVVQQWADCDDREMEQLRADAHLPPPARANATRDKRQRLDHGSLRPVPAHLRYVLHMGPSREETAALEEDERARRDGPDGLSALRTSAKACVNPFIVPDTPSESSDEGEQYPDCFGGGGSEEFSD